MKTRIVSAAIGLILFIVIVIMPAYIFAGAFFFLTCVAMYEYKKCIKHMGYNPFEKMIYLPAIFMILLIIGFELQVKAQRASILMLVFILGTILLFMSHEIIKHKNYHFVDMVVSLFGGIYIVPFFASIIAVRYLEYGFYNIFFIFIGAWATDTFAYFSGRFFGKHKLIPLVSPKKTIEGSIGGTIGTIITVLIYGIYLNKEIYNDPINILIFVFLGLFLAISSQFGDLVASSLKRNAGIKDFGNIMPGHGGVLDRFDSVLFTGPITLLFIMLFF